MKVHCLDLLGCLWLTSVFTKPVLFHLVLKIFFSSENETKGLNVKDNLDRQQFKCKKTFKLNSYVVVEKNLMSTQAGVNSVKLCCS